MAGKPAGDSYSDVKADGGARALRIKANGGKEKTAAGDTTSAVSASNHAEGVWLGNPTVARPR
jgi:hypothetical protein